MSLLLDHRIGSGDLEDPLKRFGIEVDVMGHNGLPELGFADAAFLGHGPEGEDTVPVGIEIKKIRDLMTSIQTGRLSGHQLGGLLLNYRVVILLVEGLWRPNPLDGLLEFGKVIDEKQKTTQHGTHYTQQIVHWYPAEFGQRRYLYAEIDKAIRTLSYKAGLYYTRTLDRVETAHAIRDEYTWWTDKDWEQHRSHLGLHRVQDTALLHPPSLRRRVAREFPGIGDQKSSSVAAHFGSTKEMINSPLEQWLAIEGIGKTIANRIIAALEGE